MHKHVARQSKAVLLQRNTRSHLPSKSARIFPQLCCSNHGIRAHSTANSPGVEQPQVDVHVVKKTRTRKAFTELPKTFTAPDGKPASPLGPWLGGLARRTEDPSSAQPADTVGVFIAENVASFGASREIAPVTEATQYSPAEATPKRRIRTRKAEDAAGDTEKQKRQKRTRKSALTSDGVDTGTTSK